MTGIDGINGPKGPGPSKAAGINVSRPDEAEFQAALRRAEGSSPAEAKHAARLDELKAQVAAGTYKPDMNAVAEKLLQAVAAMKDTDRG